MELPSNIKVRERPYIPSDVIHGDISGARGPSSDDYLSTVSNGTCLTLMDTDMINSRHNSNLT